MEPLRQQTGEPKSAGLLDLHLDAAAPPQANPAGSAQTKAAQAHPPSPWRSWKVEVLSVAGLAALVALAILAAHQRRGRPPAPIFTYESVEVARGPIQARVTATGTVNPIVTVQVGAQVSGTIEALGADFNSVVKPGQMMAQIDPRLFKASVAQAEANLLAAKANVQEAKANFENAKRQAVRNRALVGQKLISQQDADTTDTTESVDEALVRAAEASEAQATAALKTAQTNLAYTTIVSPIAGTVITATSMSGRPWRRPSPRRRSSWSARTSPRCRWTPTSPRRMWDGSPQA